MTVICLRESRAKRRAQRDNEKAVIEIEKAEVAIKGYEETYIHINHLLI